MKAIILVIMEQAAVNYHGIACNDGMPDSCVISGFVRILYVRIILDHYTAVELSEGKVVLLVNAIYFQVSAS